MQLVPDLFQYIVTQSAGGILIVDRESVVRFANPAAASLLGRQSGELVGHPLEWVLTPGEVAEFECARADSSTILVERRVTTLEWGGEIAYVVHLRDITDHKRADPASRRRDAILEAVSFAAEQFLKIADWKACIPQVLERLGQATGVSRVYIFENTLDGSGQRLMSQRFEWTAPGIASQIDNPRLQNLSWQAVGLDLEVSPGQSQVVCGHTQEFPESIPAELLAEDIRSIALVPIFVGQEWWGFIGFDECLFEREWSAAEIDALRAAAGALGATIQRERAEAELRAQKQLFENLVAVARATAELPTLKDTLRSVLDVAIRLTGAQGGDVLLLDSSGAVIGNLLPPDWSGAERQPEVIASIMEKGLAGWVARHRRPVLIADTRQDERWLVLPGDPYHARSALSVPIMSGSALTGLLTLTHTEPNHFTADHLHFLQAAADQMALALHNAQMFDELGRVVERQVVLYETLRVVSGKLEPGAVVHEAVKTIIKVVDWPYVCLAIPDEDGTHWRVAAVSGQLSPAEGMRCQMSQGVIGRAFRTARTQRVANVSADPDYVCVHPAMRSELAVPLCREGRVLGVLNIESSQPDDFNADDILLAESVAEAIALALDHARLYAQARRNASDLSALYALTLTTSRSLALEDVLDQALSTVLTALEFEGGAISLADADDASLHLVAARGLPDGWLENLQRGVRADTLCAYAHHQRENLALSDPGEAPAVAAQMVAELSALGWSAFAATPLLRGGQSLGAMSLFARRPRTFLASDVALLTTIGQQVATAVANARLFQATQTEHGRLQALIKASQDGVVLIGMDGRILVVNAPVLKLLGLPDLLEDWLGRRLRDLLAALRRSPSVLRTALAEVRRIQTGREPPAEGECEFPSCTFRWLSLPVLSGDQPVGRLVMLHDVTAERAAERLREDMISTMVHDLRNPVGAAVAAIELLKLDAESSFSSEQNEALELAYRSLDKVADRIGSILDIRRLENGQVPIRYAAVQLDSLVDETLRAQSSLAAAKFLRLENQVPPNLPAAWADAELIGRVLQNLVDNAIKFTPPDGVIRVSARLVQTEERLAIQVSVSDTGPGIPTTIKGQLFQKFITGRQPGHGSGLGLAFCKLVLEAHGGRIWADSDPEHGTTFTFSLTVAPA